MELIKYTLEYPINTSPSVLYKRLSTASGLSEWFADDVHVQKNTFTFFWNGSEQEAKILNKKEPFFIKYQWIDDKGTDKYFEFLIQTDDITSDKSLIITDFAEDEEEKKEAILLWNTQIDNLKNAIGI